MASELDIAIAPPDYPHSDGDIDQEKERKEGTVCHKNIKQAK